MFCNLLPDLVPDLEPDLVVAMMLDLVSYLALLLVAVVYTCMVIEGCINQDSMETEPIGHTLIRN